MAKEFSRTCVKECGGVYKTPLDGWWIGAGRELYGAIYVEELTSTKVVVVTQLDCLKKLGCCKFTS